MTIQARDFDSFGDFGQAVARYGISVGADFDPRLVLQATPTGLNAGNPAEGAFLVPTEYAASIWEKANSVGQILRRCTKQPVTAKFGALSLPTVDESSRANGSRAGGFALQWLEEAEQFPQSNPKFGRMKLHPRLLGGVIFATNELLGDAPAFGAWLDRAAGTEVALTVEDTIISGSGVNQPLGILDEANLALIRVEPESGQAAGTVIAENASAMAARLWSGSYASAGTAWVTGNDAFRLLENERKRNGAALVEFRNGQAYMMQWPVLVSEYAKPLGQEGDLILADFGEYIVSERETGIISSIHLKWLTDESAFRIKMRVDGQPGWSSPITPKNSSITQSAFVTLAAR